MPAASEQSYVTAYLPGTDASTASPPTSAGLSASTSSEHVAPCSTYRAPIDITTFDWPARLIVGGVVSASGGSAAFTTTVLATRAAEFPLESSHAWVMMYVPAFAPSTLPVRVGVMAPSSVSVHTEPSSAYVPPCSIAMFCLPMSVIMGDVSYAPRCTRCTAPPFPPAPTASTGGPPSLRGPRYDAAEPNVSRVAGPPTPPPSLLPLFSNARPSRLWTPLTVPLFLSRNKRYAEPSPAPVAPVSCCHAPTTTAGSPPGASGPAYARAEPNSSSWASFCPGRESESIFDEFKTAPSAPRSRTYTAPSSALRCAS